MRILKVRQIDLKDGCKHVAIHNIPYPEFDDKGFYRTSISYSAFFEGTKGRNKNEDYLFYLVDRQYPGTIYELERDASLPVIEHTDLLDFFKNIGYDRKTKKIYKMKDYQFKFKWNEVLYGKGAYVRIGKMGYFRIVYNEDEDDQYFNSYFYDSHGNEDERFSCGGSTLEKAKIEAEIVILEDMFEGLFKTYEETSCNQNKMC